MAKGQMRSNREAKKPKKSATVKATEEATVASLKLPQRPPPKTGKQS